MVISNKAKNVVTAEINFSKNSMMVQESWSDLRLSH